MLALKFQLARAHFSGIAGVCVRLCLKNPLTTAQNVKSTLHTLAHTHTHTPVHPPYNRQLATTTRPLTMCAYAWVVVVVLRCCLWCWCVYVSVFNAVAALIHSTYVYIYEKLGECVVELYAPALVY